MNEKLKQIIELANGLTLEELGGDNAFFMLALINGRIMPVIMGTNHNLKGVLYVSGKSNQDINDLITETAKELQAEINITKE